MEEHRGQLKPFTIFIIFLLSVSFALAHSPLIPGYNERLGSATVIPDPTKSWAIYGELHEGMEAQYYRFNISKDQRIHISLLKSTNPDNRDFIPDFALMGPGIQDKGDIPGYVEIPSKDGLIVVEGNQPSQANYEPFSASSFYHLAELDLDAPVSGTYYIAVYEPTKGGHYSLAVGDRETYSLVEWLLIPIRLISIYQWEGQSMLMIFLPVIAVLSTGMVMTVFWKKSWIPETPFEYAGVLAGLLFFGSSALIFFEMVLSLTRAPVVPEVAITIIIGLIPILLGVAVVLVIYKKREKVDIVKRTYLITIGIFALFLWTGFLVGPGLLVLSSIMPSRKGETHVQDITKEMQTLEALLESEKRYRSVIEDQTELICRCLPDGKLILVNEAYCRYFGKKREELIGSSFMPFILSEDRERVERHFASLTPEKPVATQEQRVIAAGGEIRWQQWTNRAMFDDQGRLIEYQSVGRDITDRKKAEEALHESEERYRQLVELDPDSIIVHREGRLVFVNPATVRLMGASSPEDLIGKPVLDFVAPENREIIIKRMQHILETHEPVNLIEEKLIRMDGSLIDVEITGTFITFEGKPAVQTVVHNITERKLAEEALRESEERFRLAFENAYIGMYLVDLDGRLLKVNNQMCEIFGYNQEELESMTVNDITHPEDLDTSPSFIQQALSGEIASGTFEKRYIHKQGNIVHGLVSSSLVRDSEGTPLYFISQVQDITERKQVEENLKFRNIVLSTQQETSLDGILIVDEQGKIISFNQRFVDMWDIPPEVIAPHSEKSALQSVLDKIDDPESFLSRIEYLNTHRGEKSLDEIALKDGRILDRYSAPMLGPDEKYYGRVWYFRDITDRRQAESKLRTALQQFSDIIELLPDATFVIDSEKKVIAWNRAIEEMTGVKKKEIIGKGDYAYAIPFYKERRPILIDLVFANDSEIEQKYDFVGKKENSLYAEAYVPFTYGGKGAYLSGVAAPLFDGSGKRVGAIESIRDITERKLAEDSIHKYAEELERSNEFKDLFTDILSHDLLNPAGIIKGYTDVLLDMEKDEQKLHALQAINRNNERLIDLIERASTFAKLESMEEIEFKEMDIGPIFKEVVDNFRLPLKEKQMIIEFVADGTYPASVNPVIEEVFTNLLSNAIKYSPEESKIIIDITDSGDDWKVSVTDFGVGISNEDKPRIFERFRRVGKGTTKGTGLGLAIVKRIIDLHGGSVGIEDNPAGQGCMFWITVRKA